MKGAAKWGVLIGLVFLQELPLLWLLNTAIRPEGGFLMQGTLQLHKFTAANFQRLFVETEFGRWCINSLALSIVSASIATCMGNVFAFSLRFTNREVFRQCRNVVLAAYLIPSMFLVFPLQWMISVAALRTVFYVLPLVYQLFLVPVCVWIGVSYVDRIPSGVIGMARLDGIDLPEALWFVYRPYAGRACWVSFALSFVLSMQEYVYAFLLISDSRWRTLPVGIADLQAGDVYQWTLIASAGITCAAIAVSFLVAFGSLFQRAMARVVYSITGGTT